MGKLIVTEFVTQDGVAQAPGGPDEDRDGDFTHGGRQAALPDEEAGSVIFEQARTMDALLLGRRTYEIFAGYWPTAPEEIRFTGLLNHVAKYGPAVCSPTCAAITLSRQLTWCLVRGRGGQIRHLAAQASLSGTVSARADAIR